MTVIKTTLIVLLATLVVTIAYAGFAMEEHVHSERWRVKTLGDSLEVTSTPKASSIAEQISIKAPHVTEELSRQPAERDLIAVTANLVEFKREFDGDYHLVLEDPSTHARMIAEIPDSSNLAPLAYRRQFLASQRTVDAIAGVPPRYITGKLKKPVRVEVTGVGFFDEPHLFHQTGSAPNGREIHPVLGIRALP